MMDRRMVNFGLENKYGELELRNQIVKQVTLILMRYNIF